MPRESYFIKVGVDEKGPYSRAMLRSSLDEGMLKRTTLVRAEGDDAWVPLGEFFKKPEIVIREEAEAAAAREEALSVVREAEMEARRIAHERKQNDAWVGGLICAVGLIVTVVSYSSASEGGGRYMVAWGAILFGAIRMIRGLST